MNSCMFETTSQKSLPNNQLLKTQNFKTSKSDLFNTWTEKRENMIVVITQKILFLQFNIITKMVAHSF